MAKRVKLEYIWLDGYKPTQMMRSKTKVIDADKFCLLKPVRIFTDPDRKDGYLIICEVLNPDGTPHASNGRATIDDDDNDFWFGFEQEYTLWDTEHHTPLGFPASGYYPPPQGPYYCSVGAEYAVGREMVEKHLDLCIAADINIEGVNAEVMKGQWEYQIFAKGAKEAGDQLWVARYLMERVGEESIAVYGADNNKRLTGLHETQAIDKFSYGVSDRGASIRIPIATVENDWKGWLEDRRPASNADPYKVAANIIKTVKS